MTIILGCFDCGYVGEADWLELLLLEVLEPLGVVLECDCGHGHLDDMLVLAPLAPNGRREEDQA